MAIIGRSDAAVCVLLQRERPPSTEICAGTPHPLDKRRAGAGAVGIVYVSFLASD